MSSWFIPISTKPKEWKEFMLTIRLDVAPGIQFCPVRLLITLHSLLEEVHSGSLV